MDILQKTPRIVTGTGALAQVAEEVRRLDGKKAMIVCGAHLVNDGTIATIMKLLDDAGIGHHVYDRIESDPGYENAVDAAEKTKEYGADVVIGIGGGSALDIAKTVSILVTNDQPIEKFFGVDLVPQPGLKKIMIPTTAGTGSEVTAIAIFSDKKEKLKKGIVSQHLISDVAVMDPALTITSPPQVTAATGMDALVHAIEAYTSRNAFSMTDLLAQRAITLLFGSIRTAHADGGNRAARERMLEGSLLAGMAFSSAGVAGVHAAAYPIGGEFLIPHGVASCIMLPPLLEFNLPADPAKFAAMGHLFDPKTQQLSDLEAAHQVVKLIRNLLVDLNIPYRLGGYGVDEKHVPALAQGLMKATRLLANNPREIALEDAEEIYRRAL